MQRHETEPPPPQISTQFCHIVAMFLDCQQCLATELFVAEHETNIANCVFHVSLFKLGSRATKFLVLLNVSDAESFCCEVSR